ncbi:DUF4097 family beta strand repeat-containing protein [Bacillus ndiopicus]|uniref:DUF4097 family beta strand repeat-containing protein n=1 Tax=Bacillus ndiopicus TaxID=1347368 RepID=UPI0005A70206|nr:DUF4097 family beta strand repeat-containing protein [Bacillus ndiopicus]
MMKKVIVVVCVAALICIWFINSELGMVEVKETKEFDSDNLHHLDFQTTAATIEVVPSPTDFLTVELEGKIEKKLKNKVHLNIVENNDRLEIAYLPKNNRLGLKLGSEKGVILRVKLPEKMYKELSIHTTSGDIHLENIISENMNITSTSGNQAMENSESKGTMILQTTSGNFELQQNRFNDFSVESTSGDVNLAYFIAEKGKVKTKSGDVHILLDEMIHNLAINTTSGSVNTTFNKNPQSLKLDFKGSSGKAIIQLEDILYEEKDEDRTIGTIGNGVNTLSVKTTSGGLTVK